MRNCEVEQSLEIKLPPKSGDNAINSDLILELVDFDNNYDENEEKPPEKK